MVNSTGIPLYSVHLVLSLVASLGLYSLFFFLNEPAPTEFSPFPLHAAFPISSQRQRVNATFDNWRFDGLLELVGEVIRFARTDGASLDKQLRHNAIGFRKQQPLLVRLAPEPQIGRAHV